MKPNKYDNDELKYIKLRKFVGWEKAKILTTKWMFSKHFKKSCSTTNGILTANKKLKDNHIHIHAQRWPKKDPVGPTQNIKIKSLSHLGGIVFVLSFKLGMLEIYKKAKNCTFHISNKKFIKASTSLIITMIFEYWLWISYSTKANI